MAIAAKMAHVRDAKNVAGLKSGSWRFALHKDSTTKRSEPGKLFGVKTVKDNKEISKRRLIHAAIKWRRETDREMRSGRMTWDDLTDIERFLYRMAEEYVVLFNNS